MGKEIFILLDGTSNSPENGAPPTNIDLLKQMLGNGTRPLSSRTICTGWDLTKYQLDDTRYVFYDRRPMLQTVRGESVHKSVGRRYGQVVGVVDHHGTITYNPANLTHALAAVQNAQSSSMTPFFSTRLRGADELSDVGEDDSLVRRNSTALN